MTPAAPGPSVTVIGEALIDLVAGPDGRSFSAHTGGSPFNVAVGLARLDVDVSLMARLGDNVFGRLLRRQAEGDGVDLRSAPSAAEPTTLAVVSLDEAAQASYEFYVEGTADWQWTDAETALFPARTTILHFGSIAAWTPPGDAAVLALARRVRADGAAIVSYDPNVRPRLLGRPEVARSRVEDGVAAAHLVKASADDVAWLYPGISPTEVARRWLGLGPTVVVITDGAHGAGAFTVGSAGVRRPGVAVEVVDTVGAGDSFTSALLASLLRRGVRTPGSLAALGPDSLAPVLDAAIAASAITCRRSGADPPTRGDLERPGT